MLAVTLNHEHRQSHFHLRHCPSGRDFGRGDLFGIPPASIRTYAERRPHLSLWPLRLCVHGRRGRGSIALLSMRADEPSDPILTQFSNKRFSSQSLARPHRAAHLPAVRQGSPG
jgi:hypothetical protein